MTQWRQCRKVDRICRTVWARSSYKIHGGRKENLDDNSWLIVTYLTYLRQLNIRTNALVRSLIVAAKESESKVMFKPRKDLLILWSVFIGEMSYVDLTINANIFVMTHRLQSPILVSLESLIFRSSVGVCATVHEINSHDRSESMQLYEFVKWGASKMTKSSKRRKKADLSQLSHLFLMKLIFDDDWPLSRYSLMVGMKS